MAISHTLLRSLGLGLVLAAGVAACALADPYNPARLAPGDLGQVGHACGAVLGLDPGEAGYNACVESLSQSVSDAGVVRAAAVSAPTARGSWYAASPSASFDRAEAACAAFGLGPRCASKLNAAIVDVERARN